MKINIKDEAKQYLSTKIPAGSLVLLATDDGSNKYSTIGGSCAIGNKFQLVLVKQADPDFQIEIENNAGYQLFMSKADDAYLGNGLVLDRKYSSLVLKDDSGMLDNAVSINDARDQAPKTTEEKKAEMQAMGNTIC